MPINLIVIIAIAVLVLVVLAAFFTGALGTGTASINRAAAIDAGCQRLRTIYNCDTSKIDTIDVPYKKPGDTVTDPTHKLREICNDEGLTNTGGVDECAVRCNCPTGP